MKKANSIELMIMGMALLPLAYFIDNLYARSILAVASIVLNIFAIVKSFKEKKKRL